MPSASAEFGFGTLIAAPVQMVKKTDKGTAKSQELRCEYRLDGLDEYRCTRSAKHRGAHIIYLPSQVGAT
jgi:hypothetical protein